MITILILHTILEQHQTCRLTDGILGITLGDDSTATTVVKKALEAENAHIESVTTTKESQSCEGCYASLATNLQLRNLP